LLVRPGYLLRTMLPPHHGYALLQVHLSEINPHQEALTDDEKYLFVRGGELLSRKAGGQYGARVLLRRDTSRSDPP